MAETIRDGESAKMLYELQAWVVMPNHVHLLILPRLPDNPRLHCNAPGTMISRLIW